MRTLPNPLKLVLILGIIGVISIVTGFLLNISICMFYNTTGIPSPSCGMTRAFISLFKGNIADAFWYHPLFVLPLLLPLLYIKPIRDNKKCLNTLIAIGIIVLLVTWVIRLVLLFPNREPFLFNPNALIPRIYDFIFN
ncbi:uncharacterized protein DUF2752 [Natranaerovirga pectinivora]|uniref:Uncharacterized protein DUF2752 n=1 Tax=Natranaerovirga pectinivora TaxID=682400 RepID=A0A4V2V0H3_9FIRM|nr:DUF2752 domain-containing protein [Natranaerovirga pectinivora]TCT16117.1 uncharacterized protein DUF2752 [Natranaerovirga pectinivora]